MTTPRLASAGIYNPVVLVNEESNPIGPEIPLKPHGLDHRQNNGNEAILSCSPQSRLFRSTNESLGKQPSFGYPGLKLAPVVVLGLILAHLKRIADRARATSLDLGCARVRLAA